MIQVNRYDRGQMMKIMFSLIPPMDDIIHSSKIYICNAPTSPTWNWRNVIQVNQNDKDVKLHNDLLSGETELHNDFGIYRPCYNTII